MLLVRKYVTTKYTTYFCDDKATWPEISIPRISLAQ